MANPELMDWDALKAIAAFVALWTTLFSGVTFWAIKWLLDRHTDALKGRFDNIDSRFTLLEEQSRKDAEEWHRVERSLLELRADLPLHYVRKEDAIRSESVLQLKVDALADKIDNFFRSNK